MIKAINRRTAISGIAALGAGAVVSRGIFAQDMKPLVLGIISPTIEYYPVFVGQEMGYFAAEGIDLDVVATGSSANSAQMAAAGAVNLGNSSWLDTVRGISSGAPLVIVASS